MSRGRASSPWLDGKAVIPHAKVQRIRCGRGVRGSPVSTTNTRNRARGNGRSGCVVLLTVQLVWPVGKFEDNPPANVKAQLGQVGVRGAPSAYRKSLSGSGLAPGPPEDQGGQ